MNKRTFRVTNDLDRSTLRVDVLEHSDRGVAVIGDAFEVRYAPGDSHEDLLMAVKAQADAIASAHDAAQVQARAIKVDEFPDGEWDLATLKPVAIVEQRTFVELREVDPLEPAEPAKER